MPKVSVIVPVYNVEQYLRECLDSLICQTLEDIEIICVDDCSTDRSLQILEEYAKKDKRIIIQKHQKNKGLSASRNTALSVVKSAYVMNCDSDDLFVPEMCEKMYQAISKNDVDLAICGIKVFYETEVPEGVKKSDKLYYSIKNNGIQNVTDKLILNINASFCNKIVSTDLIKKHQISFPEGLNYEDAYFHFAYMPWVKKVCFIDENLYQYRRRANSIMCETFRGKAHAEDHLEIAFALYKYYLKHKILDKKYELFWTVFCSFYWFAVGYTKQTTVLKKINNTAKRFIKQKCNMANCSPKLQEKLDLILEKYELGREQIIKIKFLNFIPLCVLKNKGNKKYIKILGVPVFKIKQKATKTKIYIFGIPLFKVVKK